DTIWYYEHPYPAGYKSYSKTKPIRFEEFKPEQDWWGSEANDFADRVENEFAWKVDFKTKREQAEAAAQPHWDRAEHLGNEA
ncbi:SAM-dependent DNA methyltransferase, partial [Pseudomonas sp. SIMBA_021]